MNAFDITSEIAALGLDADLHAALLSRLSGLDAGGFTERELLSPSSPGPVSMTERQAVAYYASALLGDGTLTARHRAVLIQTVGADSTLWHEIDIETRRAAAVYPAPSPTGPASRAILGERLTSAFRHIRETLSGNSRASIPHGWDRDSTEILSRLLTLVIFQSRLLAGLGSFAAAERPIYAAE